MSIQAFFIRGGQNWGHRAFFPAHVNDVPETEVLSSFLVQFYEDMPPPKRILVDRDLADRELLEEALSERAGRKIAIEVPQRGARRKLMEQATRNAEEALDRRLAETTTQGKILRELADTFELADVPKRIEVYDNSHIMGTNATGAMIVAGPEGFRKNSYRKFNIKRPETQPGDDFAMMREVLERRFARLEKEDPDRQSGEWPDLLLIDGGKGQLSAVCEVMEDMGVHDVPVVGVAKGPDHGREGREIFHLPGGREMTMPPNSALLFYLQRLRDEAHRFAIGTHRAKRAKSLTTSTLDDVPGIGPTRKRALLMHFGTARAVKGAALEDLEKAPGISRATARQVYDYFHPARLMRFETTAIVCALRNHGEHGAVVRLMTPEHGLQAAYVRGARGRRMRPVLIAGNVVQAQLVGANRNAACRRRRWSWSTAAAPLLSEPLPAAAIEWATVLTATVLPEGQPYPRLYEALEALLDAIEAAPSAQSAGERRWSATSSCCWPSSASGSTSSAAR